MKMSETQHEFFGCKDRLVVYRGGIRSGKTRVACYKAIDKALHGRKQIFVSVDYTQTHDVAIPTFRDALADMGLEEGKHWALSLSNNEFIVAGTSILLRSAERADRLRGISAADACLDEARDMHNGRSVYDIVIGRLSDCPDGQVYITSSPNGRDWVWSLAEEQHAKVFVQRTDENPFVPDEYVQNLKSRYFGAFALQELCGQIIEMVGEIIDPSWFKVEAGQGVTDGVRYWDLAFTDKKGSDYSAGALCHMTREGRLWVDDIIRLKAQYPDLKETIVRTALQDGIRVRIGIEEAGQQRAIIDDLARDERLRRHTIVACRAHGTKLARAMPWVSRAKLGHVSLAAGGWTQPFLAECASIRADETQEHDDMVDSVSGAWGVLGTETRSISARMRY